MNKYYPHFPLERIQREYQLASNEFMLADTTVKERMALKQMRHWDRQLDRYEKGLPIEMPK